MVKIIRNRRSKTIDLVSDKAGIFNKLSLNEGPLADSLGKALDAGISKGIPGAKLAASVFTAAMGAEVALAEGNAALATATTDIPYADMAAAGGGSVAAFAGAYITQSVVRNMIKNRKQQTP